MVLLPLARPSADLNLRLLRYLIAYVRDHFDAGTLKAIAAAGGVEVEELWAGSRWVSMAQFDGILNAVRTLMPDDETFKYACAYNIADIPGPIRFCMGAVSPLAGYELGCKIMPLVTSISAFKCEMLGNGRVRMRYETTRKESRLMCLSRQAQIEQVPTLWGMPPAHLSETRCVTRGDDACTYEIHVFEPRRWLPAAAGATLGAGLNLAWLLSGFHRSHEQPLTWLASVTVGCLLGHLYEYRRVNSSNRRAHDDINAAYIQAARDESSARRELFVLMQRQDSWGQLMETEVVERAQRLQDVAGELERLQGPSVARLHGGGDEFKSPLESARATLNALRTRVRPADSNVVHAFERIDDDIEALGRKLRELGRTAASGPELLELVPKTLDTSPLVDELRTRLRALVHLPDVRVSVFAAREAPGTIRTDIALFNRIVDNLLVNAASQTVRGSIIIEVSGTPGFLTIKISDTGPGMDEAALARLFRPLQRTPAGPATGVGLSVVVQLLALIGGRLEVMSTVGRGATFWAHVPVDSEAVNEPTPARRKAASGELDDVVRRVVTVRRSELN
jgi:signal transduction histidine kinase